jgi:hypothetical protein
LTVALAIGAACANGHRPAAAPSPGSGVNVNAPAGQASEPNSAGDIPDTQAFVAFTAPDGSFTVQIPEGWARTDAPGNVTFSDNYNSVTVESHTGTEPTVDSVRSTELATIAGSDPSVTSADVRTVDRAAGHAILVTFNRNSAPNPVTGKVVAAAVERYEFFHAGHIVVLTLAGPVGADNVDPWRKVTDSFRWLP